jgi:hypothetical protein
MRKELAEKIYQRCPIIYRGVNDGPKKNLMCFGFECRSGWFEMILMLSEAVEKLAREKQRQGVDEEELPIVIQVKEKFGGLRFYVQNASEEIYDLISKAEQSSYGICEICGAAGGLMKAGPVVMTRCQKHLNSFQD